MLNKFIRSISVHKLISRNQFGSSPPSVMLKDRELIDSKPNRTILLESANDDRYETNLTALLELQNHKRILAEKQRENISFPKRKNLHRIWNRIDTLERRLIRRLFD